MNTLLPEVINGDDVWEIGPTIRERRNKLGWSMRELSRRTQGDITPQRIGRIEREQCRPHWHEILWLLEELGVGFDLVLVGV